MAMSEQQADCQYRSANKEPEWSSICNNVFDQYLDTDDLFGFDAGHLETSSSDESDKLFDFSTGSEQSHQTSATSPIPSWDLNVNQTAGAVVVNQPKAQEPGDYWTKTLRALEQNAAQAEKKQRVLRNAKSHGDFLSLGGYPSPLAIPSSQVDQSASRHRRRSRGTANGRSASQARSASRGRPLTRLTGVTKSAQTTSSNPYATVRKYSTSPTKMMTPSRFRAGFRDVWAERTEASPKKYQLRVPSYPLPESPPPSTGLSQDDQFAVFGSPVATYPPAVPMFDDDLSPLTTNFQQAHIHTPIASPTINSVNYSGAHYFEPLPPVSSYTAHAVPLNDTAPLHPKRGSSLAPPNPLQTFDFGFPASSDLDAWDAAGSLGNQSSALCDSTPYQPSDPFGGITAGVLPSIESSAHGLPPTGLGILPGEAFVSHPSTLLPQQQATLSDHDHFAGTPYYIPPPAPMTMPNTPHHHRQSRDHRRSQSRLRSDSPSPPRNRRSISRSRRASRHRRTKSTNSTPRHAEGFSSDRVGFVNFTPHDSNKILSGVAPSGSSKTKARREKEAADKKRKFSQAAVRAVIEAGGDLDALNKAGVLV